MALIHHPILRANSQVPDETVDIWAESGWKPGPHPDSDPDSPFAAPPVLPAQPPPTPPAPPTVKKD